jgi:hypothetical protein
MKDFWLYINKRADDRYEVLLVDSPFGGMLGRPLSPDIDPQKEAFVAPIQYLSSLIARPDDLKQLGEEIRKILLPGEIWERFRLSRSQIKGKEGFRVRLQIDKNAAKLGLIPWEYCYYAEWNEFFALRETIPFVRYIGLDYKARALKTPRPRLLIAMASPDDPRLPSLNQANEETEISKLLENLAGQLDCHFLPRATLKKVKGALQEGYDIFHFLGHGLIDTESNAEDNGKLALEDEQGKLSLIDNEQLRVLLQDSGVKLVVLTACETAKHSEGDIFKGVAQSLVQGEIPAVIAMQFVLDYKVAHLFIHDFYDYLTAGVPVDRALTLARISVHEKEKISWGIPVLFLQSEDGILWRKENAQDSKALAEAAASSYSRLEAEFPTPIKLEDKLHDALLTLNFTYHVNALDALRQKQPTGAFLLSGPPDLELDLGFHWLMSRMLKYLEWQSGLKVRKLSLSASSLGVGLKSLWRQIAKALNLPAVPEPTAEQVAEAVANQLKTQHLALIFEDLKLVHLETLRTGFWSVLENAATPTDSADTPRRGMLLMFLVDKQNKMSAAQLEPIRRLLPLEPFAHDELLAWHGHSQPLLPEPLRSPAAMQNILAESEGVPDLVLEEIARLCDCDQIIDTIKE